MTWYDSDRDADNFEAETEHDRLLAALTGTGAEAFIVRLHASQASLTGHSKLAHLHAVAELSARYADKFYSDADFYEQSYRTKVCRLSGLLHETMRQGGIFEDLIDIADERVATIVGALTPDHRLPHPIRIRLLTNQVGRAGELAQIVQLADLQHECFQFLQIPDRSLGNELSDKLNQWRWDAVDLLGAMGKIRESVDLAPHLVKLKTNLYELGEKCQTKPKRK